MRYRRNKRAASEVASCGPAEALPIIGVPALLQLAEWSRKRREPAPQGATPCDHDRATQSPPAPTDNEPGPVETPLADPPAFRPPADPSPPQPRRRSAATAPARRPGGQP